MAERINILALFKQLAASLAVGIAGVTIFGAGRLLRITNLGLLVEASCQMLCHIDRLVVLFGLLQRYSNGCLAALCGIKRKGQRHHSVVGCKAVRCNIAEGDLAGFILVRGIRNNRADISERQQVCVILDRQQAIGVLVITLRDDRNGYGLFVL